MRNEYNDITLEQLGYKCVDKNGWEDVYLLEKPNCRKCIHFHKNRGFENNGISISGTLNIKEIYALNNKMKELGFI